MLNHLKIASHEIIQDAELLNLPSIIIICGPNNSGKSTLLRAVADQTQTFFGQIIESDDAENIYNRTNRSGGWGERDRRRSAIYLQLIQNVVQEKDLWFSDEEFEFSDLVEGEVKANYLLHEYAFNTVGVRKVFEEIFTNNRKPVIIPPKRNIQLTTNVNTEASISADGAGLLNFLFLAKNSDDMSDERKLYEQIASAFTYVSDGYKFEVFLQEKNTLSLHFSYKDNVWRPAEQCGLGLQDILAILYFSVAPNYNLICIEEPESHLHPDMQRRLLVHLKGISDRQFFLTTHSNVFLNNALIDRILVTRYKNNSISVSDATSHASILDDLGYSVADNLVSDLVVLVEGPTDVPILEEFFVKKGLLKNYEIKLWPLGGDIMDQLDLSVFDQNYNLISLLDKDPGSSKRRRRFARKCQEQGIPVQILKRYAIENYFTLRALKEVFGKQIPLSVTKLNPQKKLQNQIGIDVKKNNRRIARTMTMQEIENTDLKVFLDKVEEICQHSR